jgi:hypothetical protein
MTLRPRTLAAVAILAGVVGCKPPLHLTYDYGRAYIETLKVQADFTRPSVIGESYYLYGVEGVMIRMNAQSSSSTENMFMPTVDK